MQSDFKTECPFSVCEEEYAKLQMLTFAKEEEKIQQNIHVISLFNSHLVQFLISTVLLRSWSYYFFPRLRANAIFTVTSPMEKSQIHVS